MHGSDDEGHGRRGAGPGHDLKNGGDITGGARRAECVVEAGAVGDKAEGSHVAQGGEGDREEAGVSGNIEEDSIVPQWEGLCGGGEEKGHR